MTTEVSELDKFLEKNKKKLDDDLTAQFLTAKFAKVFRKVRKVLFKQLCELCVFTTN